MKVIVLFLVLLLAFPALAREEVPAMAENDPECVTALSIANRVAIKNPQVWAPDTYRFVGIHFAETGKCYAQDIYPMELQFALDNPNTPIPSAHEILEQFFTFLIIVEDLTDYESKGNGSYYTLVGADPKKLGFE